MNKVILMGRLGVDPTSRYTNNGIQVSNFSLATNKKWKSKDGQKQGRTEWHQCVAWGKTAEITCQYLKKGDLILVEGELQTREWTDKNENKRYTTEIHISNFNFAGVGQNNQTETPKVESGSDREMEPEDFSY